MTRVFLYLTAPPLFFNVLINLAIIIRNVKWYYLPEEINFFRDLVTEKILLLILVVNKFIKIHSDLRYGFRYCPV
jgi:hypothetical protein